MRAVMIAGLVAAVGCGDDDEGGQADSSSNQALCARICSRAASHHCGDSTEGDCQDACMEQAVTTPTQCNAPLDAFLRCAANADFTCDATTGEADARGCVKQLDALTQCFIRYGVDDEEPVTDGGTRPQPQPTADSGTRPQPTPDAGSADLCAPAAGDDACDLCTGSNCCDELVACSSDAACASLSFCLDKCEAEDTSCQQTCLTSATSAAVTKFSSMLSCFGTQCASECGSDDNAEGDAGIPDSNTDGDCLPTGVPPGYCNDPKHPVGHECTKKPAGDCIALENVSDVYCCAT